jgi:hypothetical protein
MFYDKEEENLVNYCKTHLLIENDGMPVRETYGFLAETTDYTEESIKLYRKFENFYEVNQTENYDKVKLVSLFLEDITNKQKLSPVFTLKRSNALSYDIAYIPFDYNKKEFIAVWLYSFFSSSYLIHPVFFQLKVSLSDFNKMINTIYGQCRCGNFVFINYETDLEPTKTKMKKNSFYCTSCNSKIKFI